MVWSSLYPLLWHKHPQSRPALLGQVVMSLQGCSAATARCHVIRL